MNEPITQQESDSEAMRLATMELNRRHIRRIEEFAERRWNHSGDLAKLGGAK